MTNQLTIPVPHKGWLPLVLITILTLAIFIVSIISLISGWQTIFQNLFYFPIILACVYYVKRGFVFSVLLACGYFVLMAIFSQDFVVLEGALIRVLIFILVAGVITYLSIIRIRAEDALKESEEFNRGLVENMPNLVVVYDHDRKIRYVNPAATTTLGYPVEEMMGTDIMAYVNPRQQTEIAAATEERFSSDTGKSLEIDLITKSGQHLTVISKGAPLHFQNKPAVLVLFADITDRKRAQEALRESEEKFRQLFARMPSAVAIYDAVDGGKDFIIKDFNIAAEKIEGINKDDLIGKRLTQAFPGVRDFGIFDVFYRVWNTGQPVYFPSALYRDERDLGTWRESWVYKLESGEVIAIYHDITERKKMEEALRESEERYRSLYADSRDAVMILSPTQGFLAANPATIRLFACQNEQDFTTHTPASLSPEYQPDGVRSADKAQEMMQLALEKGSHFFEWMHRKVDGTDFPATVLLSRLESGGTQILQATVRDITDRKHAEEALRQVNKQLNLLSSITRHDILNQLMALKGYLYLSHEEIDNPTTLTEYIQKEEQAANTIEHQIKFTKDYQDLGAAAPAWQNVNASIEKALTGLPMRDVHVEVDPKNPEIFADPLFLKVFYNLIDNALRYGSDQMKTIQISSQEIDTGLLIVCEDDGVGISAEDKKKLFTRGFGKNTGLGLFLSREILSITGITITENGVPGKGARFEITVPKGMWRMVEADKTVN
ncbi:MAG: PAS domain S-box protein [Methanoregula sp.]|nr:PAS domain S-box protein [Methanoregula sp.]